MIRLTVVRPAGFEPTASASAGLRSIQLSYERPLYDGDEARPVPANIRYGAEGGI
jgi:hypothetical protein